MGDISPHPHVLVATLGTQPQVVTLTLDELRKRYPITHCTIIHTAPEGAMEAAIARLHEALAEEIYSGITAEWIPLQIEDKPIFDLGTESEASAAFRTLYRAVLRHKQQRHIVHLSFSGGRKVLAAYAMAVAQLLFEEEDRVWHLLSEGPLLDEGRLHASPGDQVALVPVPVLRWSLVAPVLTDLAVYEDPWAALEHQRELLRQQTLRRKREFLQKLTPAERKLAELLVRTGWDNDRLAARLGKRPKTIANQLSTIFDKYRSWAGLREDMTVDRAFLIAELAPALDLQELGMDSHGKRESRLMHQPKGPVTLDTTERVPRAARQ